MKRGILILLILFSLTLVSASQLQVTLEHPFLVNNQWISASSFQEGQILENIQGQKIKIINIEDVKKDTSVFNIETSSNNYVVDNLIVHNSNSPAQPPIKTLSQARLSYAEEIIKRPITNPSQSQALLEAHNAESLWQKTHILREAGFTIEEAGALIRTHVVGRAKVSFTTRININRRLQFFVDSEAEESINAIKSMQQHHNPNHPTPLRPKLLDMTPEKLALRIEAGLEGKDFKPVGTDIASHITKGYQIHSASVVIEGQTILVRVRIENPNCMLGKILSIEHVHPITR